MDKDKKKALKILSISLGCVFAFLVIFANLVSYKSSHLQILELNEALLAAAAMVAFICFAVFFAMGRPKLLKIFNIVMLAACIIFAGLMILAMVVQPSIISFRRIGGILILAIIAVKIVIRMNRAGKQTEKNPK